MNLKHYDYLAGNSFQAYVFFSEGPKGNVNYDGFLIKRK